MGGTPFAVSASGYQSRMHLPFGADAGMNLSHGGTAFSQ